LKLCKHTQLANLRDISITIQEGAKLFISPRTVDGHRNNLLSKLDCKNIAGLVVFAIQNEVVKLSKDPF